MEPSLENNNISSAGDGGHVECWFEFLHNKVFGGRAKPKKESER